MKSTLFLCILLLFFLLKLLTVLFPLIFGKVLWLFELLLSVFIGPKLTLLFKFESTLSNFNNLFPKLNSLLFCCVTIPVFFLSFSSNCTICNILENPFPKRYTLSLGSFIGYLFHGW